MAEKKLTKVQKEILATLRDIPGVEVRIGLDQIYRLWDARGSNIRTIREDSFYFLKPWLDRAPKVNYYGQTVYTFKPGAEISDAWRLAEIERQRAEAQRRRDEDNRRKEEEAQQSQARLRAMLTELESGNIAYMEISNYAIRFEYEGKWYRITEEQ